MLGRLVHPGSRLVSGHLVLQRAGARRWQLQFDAHLGPIVPRRAFHPPPNVDSQVLVLRRR